MASKTFMARLQAIDGEASVEMPVTSVAGHPYLEHCAVLAVFNPQGSGVKTFVEEVFISPLGMKLDQIAVRQVCRITGASGEEKLPYIKMDTANDNLPSQVDIIYRPAVGTVTGATLLKRDIMFPSINNSRTLFYQRGRFPGMSRMNLNHCVSASQGYGDTQTQALFLREGEGISLYNPAGSPSNSHWVEVLFRVVATQDVYKVCFDLPQNAAYGHSFAMMNNTGSGVVLEILSVEQMEQGEDIRPVFTVERIDGIDISLGEEITAIPFDTQDSCPVTVKQNCKVYNQGYKAGALIVQNHLRKINIACQYGTTERTAGSIFNIQQARMFNKAITFLRNVDGIDSICLHEGQGIAVFNRTSNAIGNVDVSIKFRTETVAMGGGVSASRLIGGIH